MRNDQFFDSLSMYTAFLQILTVIQTSNDSTNSELMSELQKQDHEYLEKIIEKQDKILEKLAKLG